MSATSSLRFEIPLPLFFVSLQLIVVVVVVIISLVLCFLGFVCIGTTSVFFRQVYVVAKVADDPQQEDFVNCGYKLNITLNFKKKKHPSIFWLPTGIRVFLFSSKFLK
jgi:hypothetical protein